MLNFLDREMVNEVRFFSQQFSFELAAIPNPDAHGKVGYFLRRNYVKIVYSKPKNKETLSSPGRFGFLTEPV